MDEIYFQHHHPPYKGAKSECWDPKCLCHVGLWGPDPGSKLIIQTSPWTTGPFGNSLWGVDWGLTRGSMGGCWNQISAHLRCLRGWFSSTMNTFAQVSLRTLLAFNASAALLYSSSRSPNQGLWGFLTAREMICAISLSHTEDLTYLIKTLSYLHVNRYFILYSTIEHIRISSRRK